MAVSKTINTVRQSNISSLNTFTICMRNALPNYPSSSNVSLIPSSQQTKAWRKEQSWYNTGKNNECEMYQRRVVETITQTKCPKTSARIRLDTYDIRENSKPMSSDDGFEWTEDFDGKQFINNNTIYYNLKMVCDSGGAQTRTLREVYHFVKCQLEHLIETNNENTYFVNILDGDQCHNRQKHFQYLLSKHRYTEVKNKVYCGDMYTFVSWYETLIVNL
jgi:hypothetical protein